MALSPEGSRTPTESTRPTLKLEMLTGDYKQLTLRAAAKKAAKSFEFLTGTDGLFGFVFADCENGEEYSLIYECDDLNNVPKENIAWATSKIGKPVYFHKTDLNFRQAADGNNTIKAGVIIGASAAGETEGGRIIFRGAMSV